MATEVFRHGLSNGQIETQISSFNILCRCRKTRDHLTDCLLGAFYASQPANAKDSIAVGAVDSTLILRATPQNQFRVDSNKPQDFDYLPNDPVFPLNSTWFSLYALSFNTNNSADACTALPDTTPSLAHKIILIRRGGCRYTTKITNVQQYGATYVMFYNDDRPIGNPTSVQGVIAGIVSAQQGQEWINYLKDGHVVDLRFTFQSAVVVNNITGGTMSTSSSWSQTYELVIKPDVSAPGGQILSTFPLSLGTYRTLSGTSMAAPLITGIIALYQQAKGIEHRLDPRKIRDILATTATPLPFNNGSANYSFLAPVPQQGGGLVNAYQAVTSMTLISPANLALNDTIHFHKNVRITISNTSPHPVSYTIRHVSSSLCHSRLLH